MISASFITRFVISSDGASIHEIMFSGAPASTAASRTILAAAAVEFFALGCGEIILRAIRVLKIAVEVGLVVGITAAITPIGSAILIVPNALFSSITPQVFVFLYLL